MKKFFAFIFTLVMVMQLPACAKAQAETPSLTGKLGSEENIEFFSERDFDTDYSDEDAVEIVLSGNEASFDSEAVEFSGDTLKINDKGTYVVLEIGKLLQKWDQCASNKHSSFENSARAQ